MKPKIIYFLLFSFLFISLSYAQVTQITGNKSVMLPPSAHSAVGCNFTAYPTSLGDGNYEWRLRGLSSGTITGYSKNYYAGFTVREAGSFTVECRSGNTPWCSFVFNVIPYRSKSINYSASIKKIILEPEDKEEISTSVYYQISNLTTSQVVDKGYIDNKTESIDVSKLSKGIYVLNMIIDENNKVNHKFIIK